MRVRLKKTFKTSLWPSLKSLCDPHTKHTPFLLFTNSKWNKGREEKVQKVLFRVIKRRSQTVKKSQKEYSEIRLPTVGRVERVLEISHFPYVLL